MSVSKTIIISCAGMGNRLGIGSTKALVDICGKPLIIHQLEQLDNFDDIRIVVGFQAEKVINIVNAYRKDILYVFNHEYKKTGTGASVSLAAEYANDYIISLDGDLLVHPDDLKKFTNSNIECVGGGIPSTDEPVFLQSFVKDGISWATGFSRESGEYEWTGLVQIKTNRIKPVQGYVYQILEPLLPLPIISIRTKEIDTMNDYENAIKWVENNYNEK